MAESTTPITVQITEQQREIVLGALYDKLLDCDRYIFGSEEKDAPGPLDTCCEGHLVRYEQRLANYRALKAQKEAVEATIELFVEKEG